MSRNRNRNRNGRAPKRAAGGGGGGASFGVKWSDDFERADSATVGGDWTEHGTNTYLAISSGKLVRTGGSFNYGTAWVASGDAVGVGKTRRAIEAVGFRSQGAEYRLCFGLLDAAQGPLDAGSNGYWVRRYTGSGINIERVINGSPSYLANRNVDIDAPGNTPCDVMMEVSYDADTGAATLKIYSNGVQVGADIVDASPGDAANIFTGAAYPFVHSQSSYSYPIEIDAVEVSY